MTKHHNSSAHDFFSMEHFNLPLEETLKVLICRVFRVADNEEQVTKQGGALRVGAPCILRLCIL